MEKLRKTVTIGCLIYGLYGLVSWLDVGTFVPPIPLKPFLFTAFLIVFISNQRKSSLSALHISFLIWLTTLIFVGQYLIETFFDYQFVHFYSVSIEPFILLGSLIGFIIFVYLLSECIKYSYMQTLILLTLTILTFVFILLYGKQIIYDAGIVIVALLVFIFNRGKKSINRNIEEIQIILNGIAIIITLEQLAFLVQ